MWYLLITERIILLLAGLAFMRLVRGTISRVVGPVIASYSVP